MLNLSNCSACGFEYAVTMDICPLCGFPRLGEGGEGGVREPRPDPAPDSPAQVECPL